MTVAFDCRRNASLARPTSMPSRRSPPVGFTGGQVQPAGAIPL